MCERCREVRCQDAVSLLGSLPPGSVPLIVADPPYGIGYHSNHYKGRNPHAPIANDWHFDAGLFLRACAGALKDGGALYLFTRYDVSGHWISHIEGNGLKLKTAIVWMKDNWTAGDLTGSFGNQYEQILFITKGRHTIRGHRWPNIWQFPRVQARHMLHPSQKPTGLLHRAICASSDAGDVVIDPCCGSGSTGEAADMAGRGFLLGDIDPSMVAVAQRRLGLPVTEEAAPPPLPDPVAPLLSPAEWGLDPDDVRWVFEQLRQTERST